MWQITSTAKWNKTLTTYGKTSTAYEMCGGNIKKTTSTALWKRAVTKYGKYIHCDV